MVRWADTGMDGSVPGGRRTGRQTQEEAVWWMEGVKLAARHGKDQQLWERSDFEGRTLTGEWAIESGGMAFDRERSSR